ncbi:hypothetical protein [Halalkalibacterium ligniniphilum]|uniref:hypothetical protein n=1 Tax=Halalkalibacterium ligniniphilum TaxID=1134413 RepID=UPI001376373C|nr:hypothetical protein [Halalkalibacterium ligniniphilum]
MQRKIVITDNGLGQKSFFEEKSERHGRCCLAFASEIPFAFRGRLVSLLVLFALRGLTLVFDPEGVYVYFRR